MFRSDAVLIMERPLEYQSLFLSLGVSFSVDKTIVRGLDYYTGTVFEFVYEGNFSDNF